MRTGVLNHRRADSFPYATRGNLMNLIPWQRGLIQPASHLRDALVPPPRYVRGIFHPCLRHGFHTLGRAYFMQRSCISLSRVAATSSSPPQSAQRISSEPQAQISSPRAARGYRPAKPDIVSQSRTATPHCPHWETTQPPSKKRPQHPLWNYSNEHL